mmetsp:Transcript_4533/g.8633  ORF Transcript_4533/g.8633 Transcript_4533/m.8633 type:complete len:210 (-) Transcript_4533:3277-3906(-)
MLLEFFIFCAFACFRLISASAKKEPPSRLTDGEVILLCGLFLLGLRPLVLREFLLALRPNSPSPSSPSWCNCCCRLCWCSKRMRNCFCCCAICCCWWSHISEECSGDMGKWFPEPGEPSNIVPGAVPAVRRLRLLRWSLTCERDPGLFCCRDWPCMYDRCVDGREPCPIVLKWLDSELYLGDPFGAVPGLRPAFPPTEGKCVDGAVEGG